MGIVLHSSPLQGFTDFRFRNAFHKYFGGIDVFYAPYIRLKSKQEIKPSNIRDILPENNMVENLVPQVMTKNADEFLFVAKFVQELGYKELNWNLGCPYPMVAKRGLGSGLMKDSSLIEQILEKVFNKSAIEISVKLRLGYDSKEEIYSVLPVLKKFPVKSIIVHPRIGKQMYKGNVDLETFNKCTKLIATKIIYNGDLNSVERYNELRNQFPEINDWMIGRWIISDPFLPGMLKGNSVEYPKDRIEIFSAFHNTLMEQYGEALSGANHLIMKMYQFWEFFISAFPNSPKGLKKIKKAKSIKALEQAVKEILEMERKK